MWVVLQAVLGLQTPGLASTVVLRSAQSMHLIAIESSEVVDTSHLWQSHLPLVSHKQVCQGICQSRGIAQQTLLPFLDAIGSCVAAGM